MQDFSEHVEALLACCPDVVVIMGPQSSHPRMDWGVHGGARHGGRLGPDAGVSGVILPASPDVARDVVEAFEADGVPADYAPAGLCEAARSVVWALARESFPGKTLVIEPPQARSPQARAAGSALALALASWGLSWGLLSYGGAPELEQARSVVDGARAVQRFLGALAG